MLDDSTPEALRQSNRILLLGAGGGYDILGAIPLFVSLRAQGKDIHLGGVSFTSLATLPGYSPEPEQPCLFAIHAGLATEDAYCPEAWLARWLEDRHGYAEPLWGVSKTGVRPLRAALAHLVQGLDLDAVVLVDGGIDLILRGDETSIGTPAEDLASLQAASGLQDLPSFVMCLGFGAELREGIPHAQVLERVAELERAGAYLGARSLNRNSVAGDAYIEALAFVRAGQERQRGTHIHHVVQSAMEGRFGPGGPDVWFSPLASLCWFFHLKGVVESHLFAHHLEETDSIWDVTATIRACRKDLAIRERTAIPL
jgi:hypothetical protein